MKFVRIKGITYNLSKFADHYDLSYRTVVRYYNKGYRNRELLKKCEDVTQKRIRIGDTSYNSRYAAAKKLGISTSTFYRKYNAGKINELIG